MVKSFVSPGVQTREIDRTTRDADTEGVGPAFIAPRKKGPAMEPVKVRDVTEDERFFGAPEKDGKDYGAYTSRLYLSEAEAPATFVRVLGMSDTGVTPGFTVGNTYTLGASGSNVIAVILTSGSTTVSMGDLSQSVDKLGLDISGFGTVTASLNRNDTNYIKKVLNTDPTQFDSQNHFVYAVYDYANKTPSAGVNSNDFFVSTASNGANYTSGFITGSTTEVISQPFDTTEWSLFGIGSRFAGVSANTEFKVAITDIKKSPNSEQNPYGTFSLEVREFNDNDRFPRILESFGGLDLDPTSRNYILKRIGDKYRQWNFSTEKFDEFGKYDNKSDYIYIIPSTDLENGNVPEEALPWGFKGYQRPADSVISEKASFPELPFVQKLSYRGNFTTKVYWGVEVIQNASGAVNHGVPSRLKHMPNGMATTTDTQFSLKWISGAVNILSSFDENTRLTNSNISDMSTSIQYNTSSTNPEPSSSTAGTGFTGYFSVNNLENTNLAKFTMPIFDGFDGVDITKEDPFSPEDMLTNTAYQTHAFRTALDMISNPDELDLNELSIPGVYASKVTDYALNTVEDRADMFYMMDISGSTVDDAVSDINTRNVDSNYAAVYYPYLWFRDDVNDKLVTVPPTVVLPAVYAFSDRVSFPWFAPAGFQRAGLSRFNVKAATDKLRKEERDKLYDNRVNPIATFARQGTVVWGQKTLQVQASALDRVNVRRMLLHVRKFISQVARDLVFEPNVASTWQKFENRVQPFLNRVRQNAGVDDFRVVLDNTTTTQDLIERNVMFGKILIQPTRAAEGILLDFILTDSGAAFEE